MSVRLGTRYPGDLVRNSRGRAKWERYNSGKRREHQAKTRLSPPARLTLPRISGIGSKERRHVAVRPAESGGGGFFGDVSAREVLLFLPAWGAFLGLSLAVFEKAGLYCSGSEISPRIYAGFFAFLAGAGFAAGIAVAVPAWLALRLGVRARMVLAVAPALLLGFAAQVFFTGHPELVGVGTPELIGASFLRRGLLGGVVFIFTAAAAARSRWTLATLLLCASAALSGLAAARFFTAADVLNGLSLPLLALLAALLLVRFASRRLYPAVIAALLFPGVYVLLALAQGSPTAPAVTHGRRSGSPGSALAGGRPNVIVIVLDTLRPDHVSFLGYRRNTTPELDGFLAGATVYPNAKSVSSWTLPAHGSLFTGLLARSHGAHFADSLIFEDHTGDIAAIAYPLRSDVPTLAEAFGRQGYVTGGIVANYMWLAPWFGLNRGFDYYFCAPRYLQTSLTQRETLPVSPILDALLKRADRLARTNCSILHNYYRAGEITDMALAFMKRNRHRPFMLFLNYWDPHSPYNPPPPFDARFPGRETARGYKLKWSDGTMSVIRGESDLDPARRANFLSQYDGEIAFMDDALGRLFEGMSGLGVFDESMVVVLSDHGESFGEHRFMEHGACLYEDEVRMLLAVKKPGQSAGEIRDGFVQTHDVMPFLLQELRISPAAPMEGQHFDDLTHEIVSELGLHIGRAEAFGERFKRKLLALYSGRFKIIRSSTGLVEIYDLVDDPGELRPLPAGKAPALAAALDAWESAHPPAPPRAAPPIDKALIDRMRSVGYLQ